MVKREAPFFIDRNWKRKLWVLSCFIFFPLFFALIFLIGQAREFISGDNKKGLKRRDFN